MTTFNQTLTTSSVTSCYLRKEGSEVRYGPAPTRNWRNTNQVEQDAVKDPIKPTITLAVILCFYCTQKSQTHETYNLKFHLIFFYNFRQYAAPSKCRPVRTAPPSLRL